MNTERRSLLDNVLQLTRKYKELQRMYAEAQKEIERLREENRKLKSDLEAALKELSEIERAINALLQE